MPFVLSVVQMSLPILSAVWKFCSFPGILRKLPVIGRCANNMFCFDGVKLGFANCHPPLKYPALKNIRDFTCNRKLTYCCSLQSKMSRFAIIHARFNYQLPTTIVWSSPWFIFWIQNSRFDALMIKYDTFLSPIMHVCIVHHICQYHLVL